jgi:thiamine biosynthesis lipoprotein
VRARDVVMGTTVTIEVVAPGAETAAIRAFEWFRRIETACTRFNPYSELMQLSARAGTPVEVSPILFEALQFARAVAEDTGGAFDPTIGRDMETRGFNREYSTGDVQQSDVDPSVPVSFRDVELDPARRTVTLRRPLVLDLGAVAKGLAVDMAVRELRPFEHFAVDAGGDMYLGGMNAEGRAWSVGVRHPVLHDQTIDVIHVTDQAVCTSGNYERAAIGRHILDARRRSDADGCASVTVVAQTAMLADALATAAFALGPEEGLALLERHGVDGLILSSSLDRHATGGFGRV